MLKARMNVDNILRHKIDMVIEKLRKWKEEEEYTPLNEFIWKLYLDTGFYNYVTLLPNGSLRQANLKMLFEKAKQYEKVSFKGLFSFINFIDKVKTSSGDMSAAKIVGENDDVVRIMSIHKSKGLEFPIVFLSSTGKKFNMQDLNTPILIHQDIGFGPQYIDSDRKIEYPSLAKEAIRIAAKEETISEEMRVLYVALTRAKEKLIITGMSKDIEKALKDKEKLLEVYQKKDIVNNKNSQEKLSPNLVGKYSSYIDWLELVYEYNKENQIDDIIELNIYNKSDLVSEFINNDSEEIDMMEKIKEEIQNKEHEIDSKEEQKYKQEILSKLKWRYEYSKASKIPTKTSVTKLKELETENSEYDIDDLVEFARNKRENKNETQEYSRLSAKPRFMESVEKLNSAQKGTLMHLCVQLLDEKKEYTINDIKEFVQDLQNRNIISEIEAKSVNEQMLLRYTKSSLWNELKLAKEIHKEEPFYINIKANTIFDDAEEDETILVQGIIDLYYIDKEGKLILVDYKTDYVPDGDVSKLEEKYKVQLDLYKKALEDALGRKVDKAMIWALNV